MLEWMGWFQAVAWQVGCVYVAYQIGRSKGESDGYRSGINYAAGQMKINDQLWGMECARLKREVDRSKH